MTDSETIAAAKEILDEQEEWGATSVDIARLLLAHDAALAELRAENERLKAELDSAECTLEDEEVGSQETFALWKAAQADRDRLLAALRPFAKCADAFDEQPSHIPNPSDEEHLAVWWPNDDETLTPTVGDCRKARDLIAQCEAKK